MSIQVYDDWTYYRIGEAYFRLNRFEPAYGFYKKAMDISPLNPDFQNKLAASLVNLKKYDEAKSIYEFVLK